MADFKTDMEGHPLPVGDSTDWDVQLADDGAESGLQVRIYFPEVFETADGDYEGCGIAFVNLTTLFDEFLASAWNESGFPSAKWFPAYLRAIADRMDCLHAEKTAEDAEMEAALAAARAKEAAK